MRREKGRSRYILACSLLHLLTQVERPHVRPDFLDVFETLSFRPRFARISRQSFKHPSPFIFRHFGGFARFFMR